MGTSPAPGIAQAATWALLLNNIENNYNARAALGIKWEGSFDTRIPWLPLQDGGGVFVLIDNIFVVTGDSKVATKWTNRILKAARTFGAELKESADSKKIISVDITPTNGLDIDFTGVMFNYNDRRPRKCIDEVDFLENPKDSSSCTCTYRQLASIVGQCLWMFRVRSEKLYGQKDYRMISRLSFPKDDEKWSSTTTISGEHYEALLRLYQFGKHQHYITDYTLYGGRNTVVFAATDASYSEAAGGLIGYAFSDVYDINKLLDGKIKHVAPVVKHKEEVSVDNSQIALEELRAVVEPVENMSKRFTTQNMPGLLMLAIDSTHAKGMIYRNLAKTEAACALLDRLYEALGDTQLYLHYIPSKQNPADALSRLDLDWNDELWNNMSERFCRLLPVVADRFKVQGRHVDSGSNEKY